MTINKEKLAKYIKLYEKEEDIYKVFADVLNRILTVATQRYALLAIIQTRPKTISSFAEKIIRKNKYKDPVKDITDLCGARIITQNLMESNKICEFIKENFFIDEENSSEECGSEHYIVTPVKNKILGVEIPEELKDKKAEIQVRTFLQHTWADVFYDRLNKSTRKIPNALELESARLAELLKNADDNIARIAAIKESITETYENSLSKDELKAEIETLMAIIENEPDKNKSPFKEYFTIGRLSILLGEDNQAYNAYLKAADLFISGKFSISKKIINAEIDSLSGLKAGKKEKTVIECAKTILLIATYLKFNDKTSLKKLKEISGIQKNIKQPVTIVAGSSEKLSAVSTKKYSSYLKNLVKNYSGTIISGGTKSGIPGLIGQVVETARKSGNKNIDLLGYIPKKLITDINKEYKLIITNRSDYSAWEPIRMWADLILNGIKPEEVTVLGISGGEISAVEYRMALAFGANLGIVKESGRAAEEILSSKEWSDHKYLHILPDEMKSK